MSLLIASFGGAVSARAGDGALFYAPATAPVHPAIMEGLKAPSHIQPPHERTCFTQAETRERVVSNKLAEPFEALRSGNLQGDALRAKLCRWKQDQFVYEISVLRDDGRIVHIYMNAQSGKDVDP